MWGKPYASDFTETIKYIELHQAGETVHITALDAKRKKSTEMITAIRRDLEERGCVDRVYHKQ
ncbi:hypothetical protein SPFM14_00272 [Salmonella phage SPFM14]|nr:hypothetical protein SPFM14_00272 [Salmonella phage SPFM14]